MAYTHLAGTPAKEYDHQYHKDDEKFWNKLKYANEANFVLMSSKSDHAYSLLDVIEFQ